MATILAVQGMQQRVFELDVRPRLAVQQHVEAADGPGRGVVDLAAEAQVGGVAARLLHVLAGDDEHAARAAGGVVDLHALGGLEDADHEPDHVARRVEVAALLARRLREHVDQKFVCRAQEVGELKVFIAKTVAAEQPHEIAAGVVGNDALGALHAHEADVVQHVFQGFVRLAERFEGLVEDPAVGLGGVVQLVAQVLPPRAVGDEEAVVEVGVFAVEAFRFMGLHALLDFSGDDLLALGVEDVGTPLQEQDSKDVVFVDGGVQPFLAEAIRSGVEMAFQFGKRKSRHGRRRLIDTVFIVSIMLLRPEIVNG